MLDILITSVFFGFSIWTIFWVFGKSKGWKIHYGIDDIDKVAVLTVILFGIIHLIALTINLNNNDRAFGKYWFGVWIYPFTYFLLTQLFWFTQLRQSGLLRIVYAIWVLIVLHFEQLILTVTSSHREYASGLEKDFWLSIANQRALNIGIYIFMLAVLMTVKKKWGTSDGH